MKIELTVAYVGFGGNIGAGEYFYSYNPNTVIVSNKDQEMEFVFSNATDKRFQMLEIISSDSQNQFYNTHKSENSRSIVTCDKNDHRELINLAILVEDTKRKIKNRDGEKQPVYISCDPQILNVPD